MPYNPFWQGFLPVYPMRKMIVPGLLLVLAALTGIAQSSTLNGVYVGAQLYTTPFEGMQINHLVYYFRNDGTFNDQLNTTDWKTKVAGTYRIQNGRVQLNFRNGQENVQYKLAANGNLESTAGIQHTLHKVKKVNTLPAATYERKTASSRGGMGTGQPNVAAFSSNYVNFDGKGRFSFNRTGVVGIGGDVAGGTIGGKRQQETATSGSYQLGDGELTLSFGNGTVSKHSFFYSPPNEEDLIVLDGVFYFRETETDKTETTPANKAKPSEQRNPATTANLPSPAELLNKLRQHYGGAQIDKITTLRETSTLHGNMQVVALTDITHTKIRLEVKQGGKMLLVKQLEGNEGWQWINGIKKPLTPDEKKELQLGLYQGILGLHKQLSSHFLTGTVSRSGTDYMLTFYIDQHKLVYLVGPDFALKGNAYAIHDKPNISVYKNFVTTNGITYPGLTESSDGQNTLTANTTSLEINPALTSDHWKTP